MAHRNTSNTLKLCAVLFLLCAFIQSGVCETLLTHSKNTSPASIKKQKMQIKSVGQILGEAKSEIMEISVDELKSKMDSKKDFILLDVRTEKEYSCGHLESSIWIPRGKVEFALQEITKDPEKEIIVYCRSGGRSALAAAALQNIGYRNVFNLKGGFRKWTQSNNSVFNMHGEIKVVNFEKKEKKN